LSQMFKNNYIGVDELSKVAGIMNLKIPSIVPPIPASLEKIIQTINPDDYILILSVPEFKNLEKLNLLGLRNKFGINPDISEPCFYNQDWYLNEDFISTTLPLKWNLLSKRIVNESRGINPLELPDKVRFPSAVLCAFTFFVIWFLREKVLWENDYVWCSDTDHNGDRIYVGSYFSINNRNGFEIHRHLSIKKTYGVLDNYEL